MENCQVFMDFICLLSINVFVLSKRYLNIFLIVISTQRSSMVEHSAVVHNAKLRFPIRDNYEIWTASKNLKNMLQNLRVLGMPET